MINFCIDCGGYGDCRLCKDWPVLDKIEEWHTSFEIKDEVPLHQHLGWTWEQYKKWVEDGTLP